MKPKGFALAYAYQKRQPLRYCKRISPLQNFTGNNCNLHPLLLPLMVVLSDYILLVHTTLSLANRLQAICY